MAAAPRSATWVSAPGGSVKTLPKSIDRGFGSDWSSPLAGSGTTEPASPALPPERRRLNTAFEASGISASAVLEIANSGSAVHHFGILGLEIEE